MAAPPQVALVTLGAPNAKHPASGCIVMAIMVHAESSYPTIPLLVHVAPDGASHVHAVQPRPSFACEK